MYYTKYDLSFKSIHNVPVSVRILVDGYTGDPIVRRLGAPPVLKTQKNGRIISTTLEFQAECQVFGEFSEMYTSDPRHFLVEVGRGDDGEGETFLIWTGYVTPEIYSEPYIAPPYDVRICANDGLGELKLYDWEAVGTKTLKSTIETLLEATGAEYAGIFVASSIKTSSGTAPGFFDDVYIDLDYMAGKSYYDVLQVVLESLDADIMQYDGHWLIIRETDATPKVISPSSAAVNIEAVRIDGLTSYTSALYNVVKTIGKMGVADLWPIGYMTRSVQPAKKKVTVTAPWHFQNAFEDPDMLTDDTWSEAGTASAGDGYTLGSMNVGASMGQVSQTFTLKRFTKNIKVTVKALAQWVSNSYLDGKTRGVGVWARYQVTRTSEIKYYSVHGNSADWGSSYYEPDVQKVDVKAFGTEPRRNYCKELSFDIPTPGVNEEVFLQISIIGYGVIAVGASAVLEDNAGYKDVLLINNGARGDADEVEITGGRMTTDNIVSEDFYEGVLVDRYGEAVYGFKDVNHSTARDFMSLNALNRAICVGLPRIVITGKFDMPANGGTTFPLLVKDGSTFLLVKSLSWDLYNEEMQIEAVSLPATSITVDSETITSL